MDPKKMIAGLVFVATVTWLLALSTAVFPHDIDFNVVPEKDIYPKYTPSLSNGKKVFDAHCISCHDKGKIPKQSVDFWDPEEMRLTYTPFYHFKVSSFGRRTMPPFDFTEEDNWDVVYYLKSLSVRDDSISSGQKLYLRHCAECHGIGGVAGKANVDLSSQQWNARKTDDQIYTYIIDNYKRRRGRYLKESILKEIKEEDVWSLVDYLRSRQYKP